MIALGMICERMKAPTLGGRRIRRLESMLFCVPLLALAACSTPLAKLKLAEQRPVVAAVVAEPDIVTASITKSSKAGVLQLPDAVRAALQLHPDILRARSYVVKSETGIALANSVWYPELTYGVSPNYSKNGYGSATAGVSQLVYDFGKSRAEFNSATALRAKSEHEVNQAKEAVTAQIAQDYTNLSASVNQIAQAKLFLAELQKLSRRVDARVSAGASDAGDSSTATVALDRAKGEVLKAQSQFSIAQSNIAAILGHAPARVSSMRDIAGLLQKIGDNGISENSPSILALQSAVDAARYNVDRARADRLPPLKLSGQYSEAASKTGFSGSGWVGLQVSGALSTSGASGQRIAAAESDLAAAQQSLEGERLRLRTALGATEIEVNAALQRAENYKRIHALATHASELSWEEYQLDKKPLNEVINAEREKYMAMSDVINAKADVIKAIIKSLANKGELADGLLAADKK
jgi:outer membrane protein, adhesin transport system